MAGFTENAFVKKLTELNSSSQSIQTLSLWLIHHRKHNANIVKIWFRELSKAKDAKKLTFMYLANDVIQNSRKKGPEFGKEFASVLSKVFQHLAQVSDDGKMKNSLGRLLTIWGERGIYDKLQITEFEQALVFADDLPPVKRPKNDANAKKAKKPKIPVKERRISEQIEVDGTVETHVRLSPHTPARDPPEPEELIKVIQDLDNNRASGDEAVRERISLLPMEVSEIALLSKIEDRTSALQLSSQVEEALKLINSYNNRLATEVQLRKQVSVMLRDFLQVQQELLAQAEKGLEDYQEKLQKVNAVRQELKSHIQNLPDLTQLPDVTGGLAPLPSAGDLFNIH